MASRSLLLACLALLRAQCAIASDGSDTGECGEAFSDSAACSRHVERTEAEEADFVSTALLQKSLRSNGAGQEAEADGEEDETVAAKLVKRDFDKMQPPPMPAEDASWPEDIVEKAVETFNHFAKETGFHLELNEEEVEKFRARFVEYLQMLLKQIDFDNLGKLAQNVQWLAKSVIAFKDMRPVITEAEVKRINSAAKGWTAKVTEWTKGMSLMEYEQLLGKKVPPGHKESLLQQAKSSPPRKSMAVPSAFQSADHWPECKDEIHRVTQQGHCGSCWAFASTSVADSRLCIALHGGWKQERSYLSRGYITSCAINNGCQGGLSRYSFELIGKHGAPTGGPQGCSPYFAEGAGTEHFQQTQKAPACPSDCRPDYPRLIGQDKFRVAGLQNYQEFWSNGRDTQAWARAKAAILEGGPIPNGIYASNRFMSYSGGIFSHPGCSTNPNHEVVTLGWGHGYWQLQNSWGTDWGEGGRMRVGECVPTDFTIPGRIETASNGYVVPLPLPPLTGGGAVRTPGRKTKEGCTCRKSWILQGYSNEPCTDYCCNPDNDPRGDWCFLEDETCNHNNVNYGFCAEPTERDVIEPWKVSRGPCTVNDEGCAMSPNYPRAYGADESCVINVGTSGATINVVDFNTETHFDTLTVNNRMYSGNWFPHGLVPRGSMLWESDGTVGNRGWQLCPGRSRSAMAPEEEPVEEVKA